MSRFTLFGSPHSLPTYKVASMLRLSGETPTTRLYTVGFCFGGRKSFNQAARQEGLDGVVGFYGMPQRFGEDDEDPPIDAVGRPVDPEQMIVVEVVDDPSAEPGEVVEEVRRGYTWRGRVLRLAEVRAARMASP